MRFNFVTKFYVQYRSEEISPQADNRELHIRNFNC